ncbi:MAG: hypothetical protein E6G35_14035 [Actinobacteria bacterium]|nr:MAG: hypothetical protein E6G35_14035 [Actinomycetota bacterium]
MDAVEPAALSAARTTRLEPGSPLVTAALDLLARHPADPAGRTCRRCGEAYPCSPGVHAAFLCRAAGLDPESIGLPAEAARWEPAL